MELGGFLEGKGRISGKETYRIVSMELVKGDEWRGRKIIELGQIPSCSGNRPKIQFLKSIKPFARPERWVDRLLILSWRICILRDVREINLI